LAAPCPCRCFTGYCPDVFATPGHAISPTGPAAGAWFIEGAGAALQIFNCNGLICGRIVWLEKARDPAGGPAQDNKNPDPAFRQRPLCGLTILHGLRPAGLDDWNSGSLYNPDDGQTYRVSAKRNFLLVITSSH
jgi:uncharacterized protein (DUF2147 family)